MGSIADAYKKWKESGDRSREKTLEKVKETESKVEQSKRIMDDLPHGLDDETLEKIVLVKDGICTDGTTEIEETRQNEGKETTVQYSEAFKITEALRDANEKAHRQFGSLQSISNFAAAAIRQGMEAVNLSNREAEEVERTMTRSMEEMEKRMTEAISSIRSAMR